MSAVIVSWNTRDLLRACLESLQPEVDAGRAEVCVVDNASSDGSPEMVAEEFPWVDLLACSDNAGFGTAVNRGAARGSGRWVGVGNADIALTPGALETLLRAGEADPDAGAIAPRLVLPDGSTQHSVFAFPTIGFTLGANLGVARVSKAWGDRNAIIGAWDSERERRVPWAIAAFLLVRRDAWEQIGGFDEHQWMYAEDLDIGWRLHRAGYATRYVPSARVHHQSSASTDQAWGDGKTARWQRSTYAWMLRRLGGPRTRAAAAINVTGCLMRYAFLAPAARLAPKRFAAARDSMRWWASVHRQGLEPARALEEHR